MTGPVLNGQLGIGRWQPALRRFIHRARPKYRQEPERGRTRRTNLPVFAWFRLAKIWRNNCNWVWLEIRTQDTASYETSSLRFYAR